MAIVHDGANIAFEGVIYEDEVVSLREKLTEIAPAEVNFDMSDCDDLHLAVIQQILAYKKLYTCNFHFSVNRKVYQTVLEGFDRKEGLAENVCSDIF